MSEAAAVEVVRELREAVREAIVLGLDGEAIEGITLLINRFPDLVPQQPKALRMDREVSDDGEIQYRTHYSDGTSRLFNERGETVDSEGGGA